MSEENGYPKPKKPKPKPKKMNYPKERKSRVIDTEITFAENFNLIAQTASLLIQKLTKKARVARFDLSEMTRQTKMLQMLQAILIEQVKTGSDLQTKKQALQGLKDLTEQVGDLKDSDLKDLVSEATEYLKLIEEK